MAEIVNLKRAKKAKARAEGEKSAAANRVRHGTPGAERKRAQALREKVTQAVDAHRLDHDGEC
jgi:hypothetical protein